MQVSPVYNIQFLQKLSYALTEQVLIIDKTAKNLLALLSSGMCDLQVGTQALTLQRNPFPSSSTLKMESWVP
jgi:uncharacterized coiled-coil protein SlyX